MISRFDFVFSYWIITWYVLYELSIISYNPKFVLVIGIIVNICEIMLMIYCNYYLIYILIFIITNTFIKLFPLWTLRNTPIRKIDIVFSIGLFLLYNFWLFVNNIYFSTFILESIYLMKENKPIGPFLYFIDRYVIPKSWKQ